MKLSPDDVSAIAAGVVKLMAPEFKALNLEVARLKKKVAALEKKRRAKPQPELMVAEEPPTYGVRVK